MTFDEVLERFWDEPYVRRAPAAARDAISAAEIRLGVRRRLRGRR